MNKNIFKSLNKINKKKASIITKIQGIIFFIQSFLLLFSGIIFIIFKDRVLETINEVNTTQFLIAIYILSLIFIVASVLIFFLAKGIFKKKAWARIITIVILFLSVLLNIYDLFIGFSYLTIVYLIYNIVFLYFFGLNKKVVSLFK